MRWFQAVLAIAMVVWGNSSFARLPDYNERQELQVISSWMTHLNVYYPDLQVQPMEEPKTAQDRADLLDQLQLLEGVMQGDFTLPPGSLVRIACGKPVCDGGGGGKCNMCQ